MNKTEYLRELIKEQNEVRAYVESMPDDLNISFAESQGVFLEDDTFDGNMRTLRILRDKVGRYQLQSYYLSSGRLALSYECDDVPDVMLFCTDVEKALEIVGQGKCHIESYSVESQHVVCPVE